MVGLSRRPFWRVTGLWCDALGDVGPCMHVASHHNPVLKPFADRLRAVGKPHKVTITAVARKLITIANALCKSRQKWSAQLAWQILLLTISTRAKKLAMPLLLVVGHRSWTLLLILRRVLRSGLVLLRIELLDISKYASFGQSWKRFCRFAEDKMRKCMRNIIVTETRANGRGTGKASVDLQAIGGVLLTKAIDP